jgi:hypothetical protein
MTVKNVNKRIGGYLVAMLLLVGIAALAGTTAQAQYPNYDPYRRDDRYRNRRYDPYNQRNVYEIARQQGYSYGMNVGAADAQRGQSYSPQRSRYFKSADAGYNSYYGNKGQYKQVFRNAFGQGYREGYLRYGGYDRRRNNGRWGNGRWPW